MKHRRGRTDPSSLLTSGRRRIQRNLRRQKMNLRLACVCGAAIGLSVTSICLANTVKGTHAMYNDQAKSASAFSAAKDFPGYVNQICGEAQQAAQTASEDHTKLLQAVNTLIAAGSSKEAEAMLGSVQSLAKQVQADLDEAGQYKSQLDAIANRDQQDYQNAEQSVVQSQATVSQIKSDITQLQTAIRFVPLTDTSSNGPNQIQLLSQKVQALLMAQTNTQSLQTLANSYNRVVGWSSAADKNAVNIVQQATGSYGGPDYYVNVAEGAIAQKQAAEAAAAAAAAKAAASDSSAGATQSSKAVSGGSATNSNVSSNAATSSQDAPGSQGNSSAKSGNGSGDATGSKDTPGPGSSGDAPSGAGTANALGNGAASDRSVSSSITPSAQSQSGE